VIFIQRDFPRFETLTARLFKLAQEHKIPLVYELDDLLWDLPTDHPDRAAFHYTDALLPMLATIIRADLVTVASPELAKILGEIHPNVRLLPNYLDDQLWELKPPPQAADSPVILGYMGGDSHLPDLMMIAPILAEVLERHAGQVKLTVWGMKPPAPLYGRADVNWVPLKPGNYLEFADFFNRQLIHLALAPLQITRFNQCKSAVKFLEYTAAGAPVLASRVSPYAPLIQPDMTGWLAGTAHEWRDTLERLIDHPELRWQVAVQAQEMVYRDWLLSDHASLWRETCQAAVDALGSRERNFNLPEAMFSIQEQWRERIVADERRLAETVKQVQIVETELAEIQHSRAFQLAKTLSQWRTRFFRPTKRNG
jgi:glycosyltransferase involved in cell wall biosynthesis